MFIAHATAIALAAVAAEPAAPTVLWKVPLGSTSFGGSAIADADGDGRPDIAFGTYFGDSKVRVLRGHDGSELWHYDAGKACLDASCRFVDLDGDSKPELVIPVSNYSRVLAFDGAAGTLKWTCQFPAPECIDTPPWIGELDGHVQIAVGTFRGNVHLINAADGTLGRTLHVAPGAVQSCPVIMDVNADGAADIIAANFKGDHRLHCVSGKDGSELWSVQTGSHMYHGPAVADLDGDGALDLAFDSYDGKVYACRASDGKLLWKASPGDQYFMAPATIVDADADGSPDVIVTSDRITALRGRDGSVIWSVPANPGSPTGEVSRGVAVADLDGDGAPDLAYLTATGLFRVLRASDGAAVYELDVAKATGTASRSGAHGPAIADLNGDGTLDVFLVIGEPAGPPDYDKGNGMAVCLTGFAGKESPKNPGWPTFRHDAHNTGNAMLPLK